MGYTKCKVIHVSIPKPACRQLQKLALQTVRTVPGYVRYLIIQELQRLNLPIYVMDRGSRRDQNQSIRLPRLFYSTLHVTTTPSTLFPETVYSPLSGR